MASGFLLDTNIVSYLLDGRDTVLIERVAAVDECRLFVSSITCCQLPRSKERGLKKVLVD